MRLLRDLWATSPRRTLVVAILIVAGAACAATASALAGPVLVDRSPLAFAALAVSLTVVVLGDLVVGLIMARLTADWAADVRRRLCRVAFGQSLPTLEVTPVGELLDRIDGDVYQVASQLRSSGIRIAQAASVGLLSTVTALFVWWPAGVAMLVLTAVLGYSLREPAQRIAPARMDEEEAWSDLAAVMEESVHGQDDVRTSLGRPYVLRLYARRAAEVLTRGRRVWRLSSRVTTIASGATRVGIGAVVLGGVWALTTGRVDTAQLTGIWLLALAFGGTVEQVSRMLPELQYALGAWARVQLLRDVTQEPTGGAPPSAGDIAVRGLTFRYAADAHRPALRDVDLTFAPGRSYALVGRTGSGKSTLAKVLTRAVDVPRGTVTLGGVDLLDLDLEALRRWIAVVPQRTEILAGTLAENIALFDPALTGAAERAVEELGLTAWVATLPDGLQTRLGEGGHVLSAGQEQLVAFARVLVRDPRVLILDEATARLDPVTEGQVQRAAERVMRGRIGIVIAHRLSSVRACDEVVVLADGEVVESGPLRESRRFAQLLASSRIGLADPVDTAAVPTQVGGGLVLATEYGLDGARTATAVLDEEIVAPDSPAALVDEPDATPPPKADPPPLPPAPRVRTLREIYRLMVNDPRFGLGSVLLFLVMVLLGLDGAVLPWFWADLVDGTGSPWWPALGISAALVLTVPTTYFTAIWFPEWWVRQMLRINLRLVHGQTGPRRVSTHTPAEVVAQGGDNERVVILADNLIDQFICVIAISAMTLVSGSFVPGLFFAGTMLVSGLTAALFGPVLKRSAAKTVEARAAFATFLVSSLSSARTVKLAGATRPVLTRLADLDTVRSDRQRREIATQVWSRSTPAILSGLLPIGAWALYMAGQLPAATTLIVVSTLGAARWFAWTTASLLSQLPSARVWTGRTVAMAGTDAYSASVPGVDISAGTAPGPQAAPRHPLRRLDLTGFTAVHEDGTVGVSDIDLTVGRGELVLVVGPVGSGKSSLLRALAGIVHHRGALSWNGDQVTEPELFLRPNQVGYVAQLPRVLSGTVSDNIRLGHDVNAAAAVATAQLEHDLAAAGSGLELLIGHKGTRLSGGQLQRLALARALAPGTELLLADDVSSALDVTTELALWDALRGSGVTVVGSTSKRAALAQADRVLVLSGGRPMAQGTWAELEDRWGHLAG
ncbi:ABC transporter ATP-binding protein/permease [Catellatospora tritici]|uniref:ABC transporter ATP-binding protein/permease n=1 Tax=Catellatospora tritici TaxID=2851566 RepID=UPI001C2D3D17|nr:ABC transporter ATP-binding protein/permease [Catellatospora tritici]MBV1854845.1 ABC transporter ATP-binding protein/permease [Catellatospora tritici]